MEKVMNEYQEESSRLKFLSSDKSECVWEVSNEAHGLKEPFYPFSKAWCVPGGLSVVHCALSPGPQSKQELSLNRNLAPKYLRRSESLLRTHSDVPIGRYSTNPEIKQYLLRRSDHLNKEWMKGSVCISLGLHSNRWRWAKIMQEFPKVIQTFCGRPWKNS